MPAGRSKKAVETGLVEVFRRAATAPDAGVGCVPVWSSGQPAPPDAVGRAPSGGPRTPRGATCMRAARAAGRMRRDAMRASYVMRPEDRNCSPSGAETPNLGWRQVDLGAVRMGRGTCRANRRDDSREALAPDLDEARAPPARRALALSLPYALRGADRYWSAFDGGDAGRAATVPSPIWGISAASSARRGAPVLRPAPPTARARRDPGRAASAWLRPLPPLPRRSR